MAVLFWGFSFVATKVALSEMSLLAVIIIRFGIGIVLLSFIALFKKALIKLGKKELVRIAILGFFSITFHQLLQTGGLTLTTATNTGWLVAVGPVFTVFAARMFLKERLGVMKITGMALALSGAFFIITGGSLRLIYLPSTQGDLLVLGSSINWAFCSVLGKDILNRHPAQAVNLYSMSIGWLLLLPIAAATGAWHNVMEATPAVWAALLYLGLGCSGLAYLLWYKTLERLGAGKSSVYLYFIPLVTSAGARLILKEEILWPIILGGPLIMAGVFIVQKD